jgi:hypothetical protein
MKSLFRNIALGAVLGAAVSANAATYTIDPSATWLGFMNVFNLPTAGGAYQFGSSWGLGDLSASFSGTTLTLAPNTIGDPNAYWYTPSGGPGAAGNKIMDANFYQEFSGPLAGQTVTFTGNVLANTLTPAHTSIAFIKDFAPDYSSSVTTTVALTPGLFNISLAAINDPARHVQFGFETIGPDVWITDVGPFGSVQITAVPEPTSITLAGLAAAALLLHRRRN